LRIPYVRDCVRDLRWALRLLWRCWWRTVKRSRQCWGAVIQFDRQDGDLAVGYGFRDGAADFRLRIQRFLGRAPRRNRWPSIADWALRSCMRTTDYLDNFLTLGAIGLLLSLIFLGSGIKRGVPSVSETPRFEYEFRGRWPSCSSLHAAQRCRNAQFCFKDLSGQCASRRFAERRRRLACTLAASAATIRAFRRRASAHEPTSRTPES